MGTLNTANAPRTLDPAQDIAGQDFDQFSVRDGRQRLDFLQEEQRHEHAPAVQPSLVVGLHIVKPHGPNDPMYSLADRAPTIVVQDPQGRLLTLVPKLQHPDLTSVFVDNGTLHCDGQVYRAAQTTLVFQQPLGHNGLVHFSGMEYRRANLGEASHTLAA